MSLLSGITKHLRPQGVPAEYEVGPIEDLI